MLSIQQQENDFDHLFISLYAPVFYIYLAKRTNENIRMNGKYFPDDLERIVVMLCAYV